MIDLRKAMIALSLRVILSGIYRGHVTIMIAHRSITYCSLIDQMAQNTDLIVVRFPMEGYKLAIFNMKAVHSDSPSYLPGLRTIFVINFYINHMVSRGERLHPT